MVVICTQCIPCTVPQVSLELEMLPRGPGEAPGTPQGSTAYSPLNSPKPSGSPSRLTAASNLGSGSSSIPVLSTTAVDRGGPESAAKGSRLGVPAMGGAIVGKIDAMRGDMRNTGEGSARISAWPDSPGEACHHHTTVCRTYRAWMAIC